jgi:protein involved in polysaccharide export with SLBB domain
MRCVWSDRSSKLIGMEAMRRTMLARHWLAVVGLALLAAASGGCASLTNPVAEGIPVRRLPDEVFARPKAELHQIPLNLLRITDPGEYTLDRGDILAIIADEVLTKEGQPVPVQFINNPNAVAPAVQGIPVAVQEDGTILLPLLDPIPVQGKTLTQTRDLIIKQMEEVKKIVPPGKARVFVNMLQPRRYRVLVVREDTQPFIPQYAGGGAFTAAVVGGAQRGAAFSLLLEPGRNDVLQALAQTGGPPGLDAKNEIIIRRGKFDPADPGKGYVRIPLRVRLDEPITFTQEDITLGDGDTVFIQSRDTEVYYTAGLLGSAQIPLPRDYDLRVIEAITQVRGPLINGTFSQNAFVPNAVQTGLGNPNASLVTVIRRLPNDRTLLIRVDLNLAFQDLRENIIIKPGDVIVLQERPSESITRYLTQQFRFTTTWELIRSARFLTIGTGNNP